MWIAVTFVRVELPLSSLIVKLRQVNITQSCMYPLDIGRSCNDSTRIGFCFANPKLDLFILSLSLSLSTCFTYAFLFSLLWFSVRTSTLQLQQMCHSDLYAGFLGSTRKKHTFDLLGHDVVQLVSPTWPSTAFECERFTLTLQRLLRVQWLLSFCDLTRSSRRVKANHSIVCAF